jgi:polyhydroxyalkanoate synthesis regulator phasin
MQEAVDDAVRRGRMTRGDANELVSQLIARSRKQTDAMLKDLERLAAQVQKEVLARTTTGRKRAGAAARRARREVRTATGRAARAARDAADQPLARADELRRQARVGSSFPITAYDQLTVPQIKARLAGLTAAELRKVRDYERRNQGRKGILTTVDKKLA